MAARMWTYHPDLLATPVPRYTSFPTAADFAPTIDPALHTAALSNTNGDVSLYLHFPFCESICWYCGCNTGAANKRARLESYLSALHSDMAQTGARLGTGATVRRVAFGGGSPNAMLPADFRAIVDALHQHFRLDDTVWSVELDPRTLTPAWGNALADVGVTHASLGVQTFAPQLQAAIGRVQPDALIADATEMLRRAGITSLNFDLMYGLPGQTDIDLAQSLERSIALGADRLAVFGYAHVPHMIPRQQRIDASALPDQAARFAMAEQAFVTLTEAGYVAVGFDHFARPDDPLARAAASRTLRRNFQGFTDDTAPVLIGLGASAIHSFPHLLVQNEKNAGRYRMLVSQARAPTAGGIVRSAADQATARIIEHLLCQGKARPGAARLQALATPLHPFVTRGLIAVSGDTLTIQPGGLPYARSVAALFDPYRVPAARTFSAAV